jgi:hypothetical protein
VDSDQVRNARVVPTDIVDPVVRTAEKTPNVGVTPGPAVRPRVRVVWGAKVRQGDNKWVV